MQVVLFNSPVISSKEDVIEMSGGCPRIGIASIAAYLLENGIDVSIVDPEIEGLDLDEIQGMQPDIVGIPAYTEEVLDAAAIAKGVKEICPGTIVVVGGPHPSAIPEETLKEFGSFDIAVVGEGEFALLDIALKKPLEMIPGIAYRDGASIRQNQARHEISDINSLPLPAWHLYYLNAYRGGGLSSGFAKKNRLLELPVEGARGCPYGCAFCFRIAGRRVQIRSPKRVIDDVARCVHEFKAERIYFVEGTFAVNRRLAIEVCDEIMNSGLQREITWSAGPRVDTVDFELLQKMKGAGCDFLGFGVESGDPQILKLIGKNTSTEQAIEVFKMCKKLGIKTEANFIIGLPGETNESISRTIELAKRLEADYANFAILVPFPGTEVYKMACDGPGDIKVKSKDWKLYGKQVGEAIEHANFLPGELKKLQMKAYRSFYLRPSKVRALAGRLSVGRIAYGLKHLR
jgi:radical SAM superfamily enzyme YgiQ (UPF0313 family)